MRKDMLSLGLVIGIACLVQRWMEQDGRRLNLDHEKQTAKRRVADAERTLFQPPLHLLRGVYSRSTCEWLVGK